VANESDDAQPSAAPAAPFHVGRFTLTAAELRLLMGPGSTMNRSSVELPGMRSGLSRAYVLSAVEGGNSWRGHCEASHPISQNRVSNSCSVIQESGGEIA
jgi:hypothetical protein